MKVLLDENLPVKLKHSFSTIINVFTVYDMKWNSLKNGELLKAINDNGFDALITSDKNLVHQHNLSKYNFRFFPRTSFNTKASGSPMCVATLNR